MHVAYRELSSQISEHQPSANQERIEENSYGIATASEAFLDLTCNYV